MLPNWKKRKRNEIFGKRFSTALTICLRFVNLSVCFREANHPQSRFEAFVDDLTAEEVLAQVQNASKHARDRVIATNASKMGFLRQNKDGTTSMKILVATDNDLPERIISLGAFTGKLQQGTGQLQVHFCC